jgi:hypothetical protein
MRSLFLLLTCQFAVSASAQSFGPALGSLRLSFDDTQAVHRLDVEAMQNFSWYLQVDIDFGSPALNFDNGLVIWEAALQVPPQVAVLSLQWLAPYAFCDDCSNTDWRALLASCVFARDTPKAILQVHARLLVDANDLEIGLGPASPSNFDSTAPGWRVCANTGNDLLDLHPFASGWTDQLVINSTVATTTQTWSSLKTRY